MICRMVFRVFNNLKSYLILAIYPNYYPCELTHVKSKMREVGHTLSPFLEFSIQLQAHTHI